MDQKELNLEKLNFNRLKAKFWYEARQLNIHIFETFLIEQAKTFAKKLDRLNFQSSGGKIGAFKKKYQPY